MSELKEASDENVLINQQTTQRRNLQQIDKWIPHSESHMDRLCHDRELQDPQVHSPTRNFTEISMKFLIIHTMIHIIHIHCRDKSKADDYEGSHVLWKDYLKFLLVSVVVATVWGGIWWLPSVAIDLWIAPLIGSGNTVPINIAFNIFLAWLLYKIGSKVQKWREERKAKDDDEKVPLSLNRESDE
jgi:hypothetical protein